MPRKTIIEIMKSKESGEPLVCLTAYTAPLAQISDLYADIILVGDSVGMVLYGMPSTVSVTLDMMIAHGKAVVNATEKSLVVVDMPFGSYQESKEQAYRHSVRVMQETNCTAVKLEGGQEMAETISYLTQRGVPVMGHIGLQPQSVHSIGGYRIMGKNDKEEEKILIDARSLLDAGVFSMVLECVEPVLAEKVTIDISVPTIGIGSSPACDGQILVTEDFLGLTKKVPKFVKKYARLGQDIEEGIASYAKEVRARRFPVAKENFSKNKAA